MITITKEIEVFPGQEIIIVPISDIHHNSKDCDRERFQALIQWCVRKTLQGSKVLMFATGDYNDTFSPSERAVLAAAKGGYGLHQVTKEEIDDLLKGMTEDFYEVVKPMKGNFLGLLQGHHSHDFFASDKLRGMNSTEYLCQLLDCPFLGDMAVIKLNFVSRDSAVTFKVPFTIMAMHGYGSARTAGAQIAKRLRMAEVIEGADLYVMGHDNNKMVYPREPLVLDPSSPDGVSYHKQYFIGAGSFQRGYRMGTPYGGYVEQLALAPHMLGVNMAMLRVESKSDGRYRLDYHISS